MAQYITFPNEIQLLVAQYLETTSAIAAVRLTLACKAVQKHLLAVTAANDERFTTASDFKGTYIAKPDFYSFYRARENDGTLPQYRFSIFLHRRIGPACECNDFVCNYQCRHRRVHLNLRRDFHQYHGVTLKVATRKFYNRFAYQQQYDIDTFTHTVPANERELMWFQIEDPRGVYIPRGPLKTRISFVESVAYDFDLTIKYALA